MTWTKVLLAGLTAVLCLFVVVGIWRFETDQHDVLLRVASQSHDNSLLNRMSSTEALVPLPSEPDVEAGKVELGRLLFNDPRLSADTSLSCASCHDVRTGGDDGKPRSIGASGHTEALNTSSVLNSRYNLLRFWYGEPASQDDGEARVHGPEQLGSSFESAAARLAQDPALSRSFAALFNDRITAETVKLALDCYLASLTTPDTRFDRYLRGERNALTLTERQGYRLFNAIGCSACHQGRNLGGNMVQRIGIFEDYFALRGGAIEEADQGRFNLTGLEEDRHSFRVPSLRNVTRTAPYFHDGSVQNLERAVRIMARVQLGRGLKPEEASKLVTFLGTLDSGPQRLAP